ncbi:hypothetical protein DRQ09_08155 [candidate division KSB1 bacterium]|nr:MAG: hypothetical protein DRQ09_08155 [candidate division KSB1 bacterium]
MAQKILKKVVKGSVVWERWRKVFKKGGKGFYYICDAEIKNTGVSVLYNLIVLASIYNPSTKKVFSVVNNKLQVLKLAGYMVIDSLKPDESIKVSIIVNLPEAGSVISGRRDLRNLEKNIENGKLKQKVFLIYDTTKYDERIRRWFQDRGVKKIKILDKEWEIKKLRYTGEITVVCKGTIKNVGTVDIRNFEIISVLIDIETGAPLRWVNKQTFEKSYLQSYEEQYYGEEKKEEDQGFDYLEASGAQKIDILKVNKSMNFNISFKLPEERILKKEGWSMKKIQKRIDEEKIIHNIFIN